MDVVMMKGQMFLITAVFLVIILVVLKTQSLGIPDTQKISLYSDFNSLKAEYTQVVDTSLLNSLNVSENLDDFAEFSRDYYNRKGMNETVSYSISTAGSDTTVKLNIYLGNDKSYISNSFEVTRTVY